MMIKKERKPITQFLGIFSILNILRVMQKRTKQEKIYKFKVDKTNREK